MFKVILRQTENQIANSTQRTVNGRKCLPKACRQSLPEARLWVELVAVHCKHFYVVGRWFFQHDRRRLSPVLTKQDVLDTALVYDAVCYHSIAEVEHLQTITQSVTITHTDTELVVYGIAAKSLGFSKNRTMANSIHRTDKLRNLVTASFI